MTLSRLLLPLCCAFALLFAQQEGAAHALSHALEQQEKRSQNSPACEKCEHYAQLGNALQGASHALDPLPFFGMTVPHRSSGFHSSCILSATARAPPQSFLQTV